MDSMQIVFLFDLNAFNGDCSKSEEIHGNLVLLRLSCLRILTHYSSLVSNLKWGFKFFDSRGSLTQIMCNFSFPSVSLESFETLENEICIKYQRHFSYLEALTASTQRNDTIPSNSESNVDQESLKTFPIKVMQLAFTQMLYEYKWKDSIEIFSPNPKRSFKQNASKRNILFLFSKCASNADDFQDCFGVPFSTMTTSKINKLLLSQSLQDQFLEKASILWVWLNTSTEQGISKNAANGPLVMIASAMEILGCNLMPLSALSQQRKFVEPFWEYSDSGCKSLVLRDSHTSLIPSSVFLQNISCSPYLNEHNISFTSDLILNENGITIPLTVQLLPLKWERACQLSQRTHKGIGTRTLDKNEEFFSLRTFTKYTVVSALSRKVWLEACSICLCLPNISCGLQSYNKYSGLIKSLLSLGLNLFLLCESACGSKMLALFSPLSCTSAIISFLGTDICSLNSKQVDAINSQRPFNCSELLNCLKSEVKNVKISMNGSGKLKIQTEEVKPEKDLKSFQIECMETWFEPGSLSFELQTYGCPPNGASSTKNFHEKLRQLSRNCKRREKKKTTETKNESTTAETPSDQISAQEICKESTQEIPSDQINADEICKDLSYEQLIAMLTGIYESAVNGSENSVIAAKNILKLASSFFLQKSVISHEEKVKSLMAEYFLTSSRKIIENYGINQDTETADKGVNECQLQTILTLEMEMLFPSFEESSCVNMVTSLLGVMSFFTGVQDLNRFLTEVLMENYSHKLYNILIEIGEELGISLAPDDDSVSDPFDMPSSVSTVDMFDSVPSVAMSTKSCSSTSSRGDSRKLKRSRSDISDSNKCRQILLPGKSPRRKKKKDKMPMRYSPRLSSKKKREKSKADDSTSSSARRNLFPKDRKPQTPRTSRYASPLKKKTTQTPKKHHVFKSQSARCSPLHESKMSVLQRRKSQAETSETSGIAETTQTPRTSRYGSPLKKKNARTPKRHHVLKTQFVPDTPLHKSNLSVLQRRKSQMDIPERHGEIAESPSSRKKMKDANRSDLLRRLNHSQSASLSVPQSSSQDEACSSTQSSSRSQYTPDNKRRLSLKLFFSKLLTSPTAQVGPKKCTAGERRKCNKRLFDQVAPDPEALPNKRPKLSYPAQREEPKETDLNSPKCESKSSPENNDFPS